MKDLIVLTADKNAEFAVRGLLARSDDLGIRSLSYDVYVHPRRDPGCLNDAQDFLRPFLGDYRHALVLFDHSGCGHEGESPQSIAHDVERKLAANGWSNRAAVVVLFPELEVWVWSNSPHVAACLGWGERHPPLRQWLAERGHWPPDRPKPPDPKSAMEATLREVRKPRSSSIYRDLAERVPLRGHTEPAFVRLTSILRQWFSDP